MAVASPITTQSNPLKCSTSELPTNLLLMVKIIVLGFILKGYVGRFPEIFVPFFPLMDFVRSYIVPPAGFQAGLQVTFIIFAALLFLNFHVRKACLALGIIIFVATLACRGYYSNNILFCGSILFLVGLQEGNNNLWLLRYQIVLMYFGAAFNKILEPDWRSGKYFDYWLHSIVKQFRYDFWAGLLPPLVLAKLLSWGSIIGEFALSIGFALKRWDLIFVWLAVLFHTSALLISREDYGIYTIALLASFLIFIRWPKNLYIFYDTKSAVAVKLKALFERIDTDELFSWYDNDTSHSGAKNSHISFELNNRVYTGFAAFKILLLLCPITYFVLTALLSIPNPALRSRLVMLLLIFFCPLVDIILEVLFKSKK